MPDSPPIHIGENSPEEVAFKMMMLIADVEGRENYGERAHPMDREWILKTYEQCRLVVRGNKETAEAVLHMFHPPSYARPR